MAKTDKTHSIVTLRVPVALIVAVDRYVLVLRRTQPRVKHTRSSTLRNLMWDAIDLAEAKLAKPKRKPKA